MKTLILAVAALAFAGAASAQECGGMKQTKQPVVAPAPTT